MSVKALSQSQHLSQGSGTYTFSSSPRALGSKKKYRDPVQNEEPTKESSYNIMTDRRVKRGTTVTPTPTSQTLLMRKEEEERLQREKERLRKQREKLKQKQDTSTREPSPEPVSGRQHMEIQTEQFLEEITYKVIEKDVETQTDPFKERPPSPKFVPKKTGIDVETQIWDGDLFDFDTEVEPVLSVLIAKVLEQSMMEIRDEEELANMKAHQHAMRIKREAELKETKRMEEEERRRVQEKELRLQQERERVEKERKAKERAECKTFAQQTLQELLPNVFNTLAEGGYFYDPVLREVEVVFNPWLLQEMDHQVKNTDLCHQVVDDIILYTIQKAKLKHQQAIQRAQEEEEEMKAAQQTLLAQNIPQTETNNSLTETNEDHSDEEANEDDAEEEEEED